MARRELLLALMEETYGRLRLRLEGLTDEEFFWRPVPDCWTIYQDRSGHWAYDYAILEPNPAPATTIGWQLVHLGTCKLMYHEWAYGQARLTWPEVRVPGTAGEALHLLEEGQRLLLADLRALSEPDLDKARKTNWGEAWPAWRIFSVMSDHDAFHGGSIGCLRDLYLWRPPESSSIT